jgi:hypothetical protein
MASANEEGAMDARLRSWAATGQYAEEDSTTLDAPRGLRHRRSAWGTAPTVALLIPVGIACGALLAVACIARLCVLPFTGGRNTR